jgi:quercetin dioxygenase-like cupin family protein
MKTAVIGLFLFFSCSVGAQAPEPARLPGEPHHHLKIENEYVRAYYVEVPPHEATQLHQHDHDYIYISLGPADVINAVRNKPEVHLVLKDGETHFSRGGFAHVARNLADSPFRNVTVELLKPQDNARNICAPVIPDARPEVCHERPTVQTWRFRFRREFETDEVLLEGYFLGPGVSSPRLNSKTDRLLVVCDQSQIRTERPGQPPVDLSGGDSIWLPAGSEPAISNLLSEARSNFLLLSFKDSEPLSKQ